MLALGSQVLLPNAKHYGSIQSFWYIDFITVFSEIRSSLHWAQSSFWCSSRIAAESTPKMAPKTIPGIFIGYYENVHGMTKDYIVISLALLHKAKCYRNDPLSWRLTPQRVGRVIFNNTMTPQFPLKPGYDARRESILQQEFGGEPTRFNNADHIDVEVPPPSAPQGESNTDIATAGDSPVALPPDVAEYSPEILAEFPSDMQFSYNDTEVYGIHVPVRHGSMRVPDISVVEWNKQQPAWKNNEQDQYPIRCENRRKENFERVRKARIQIIGNGTTRASFAGVEVRATDISQAEGSTDNTNVPQWPHSCTSVQEEGDRVEHEKSLKAIEDNWNSVSAPCMPILTSVNFSNTGHRHFLADVYFLFNLLVAEPITRTQRKQIPKAQAACDKEWEKLLKRSTWDP